MTEVSSGGVSDVGRKHFASGGIEFHNKMRALDHYHTEMVGQINMLTRKMEAKQNNSEKFRDVRKKELGRELDELEEDLARAKLNHQQKLKSLENQTRQSNQRKSVIETRKDLNSHKIQFMRDLYKFDPRWRDKLRAKKQMELNRLEHQKQQLQLHSDNLDNDLNREMDYKIKDAKFDIYKLQKHADIKRNLLYDVKNLQEPDATLFRQIHEENEGLSDHEADQINKELSEDEQVKAEREQWEKERKDKKNLKVWHYYKFISQCVCGIILKFHYYVRKFRLFQ